MTKIVNGFHWPDRDVECAAVVFNTLGDLDLAIGLCRDRNVAVQAGGNCGVWPAHLSQFFGMVHTFEPDYENYSCLVRNVGDRVMAYNSALGSSEGYVALRRNPVNCGAYFVDGDGDIQRMRLDSLNLTECDLICLDIEGYEFEALQGAVETLERFRPVVHIEDKGLSVKYGTAKGDCEKWLNRFGYRVVHRVNRDVILSV